MLKRLFRSLRVVSEVASGKIVKRKFSFLMMRENAFCSSAKKKLNHSDSDARVVTVIFPPGVSLPDAAGVRRRPVLLIAAAEA